MTTLSLLLGKFLAASCLLSKQLVNKVADITSKSAKY
jgi:hypothetical protein